MAGASPFQQSPPALSLLKTLHPPGAGASRSWQSSPHPDPSTPLLATGSADKSVNVWSLRDFSLVSTISGGHKRSVRTVAWKDFGGSTKVRTKTEKKKPVVLGTGSFDANVGIWVWNDARRWAAFRDADDQQNGGERAPQHERSMSSDTDEVDMTNDRSGDDDDEEWHFSTLLTGPDSEIKSIEFAPPHYPINLLATSSRDKSVWIWEEVEPEEWETIAVLSEHTGDVKCVGWCQGARRGNGRRSKRRKLGDVGDQDGDVDMGDTGARSNGIGPGTTRSQQDMDVDEEDEVDILGSRPILASGSYDDTIRLWRDVEEEGDWICVGVIDGHKGTVWDLKWEKHINYSLLDLSQCLNDRDREVAIREFEADWMPRIISCSDDLTVRVWRRELSEAEKEKRRAQSQHSAPMGFASSRIPSVIRPMSAMERWVEDATLPAVHVRSVYAVDWSKRTGMVVSCGGDGTIAVYRETPAPASPAENSNNAAAGGNAGDDVVMNGTPSLAPSRSAEHNSAPADAPYRLHAPKWEVVALMDTAHDEFEINHVCWAERRDKDRRVDGEEMIVSTGDEGDVRIWTLPDDLLAEFD
ncbi:WD domain-containing protein [Cladophialophora immunda]|nr:WD domain-containing protein [Cladophialophora immunda]